MAYAQDPPEPAWHQGVSAEDKQKAIELFLEGKKFNEELLLGQAVDKYEEALKHWEQAQLRFYLARVQKRMGLPLAAHENLKKALSWGHRALEPDEKQEALDLLQELELKELGRVAVRCDEEGAEVLLDGKAWGAEGTRLVLPGEHVVTAKKAGYYTTVKPIAVSAGKEVSGVIHLSIDTTLTKRRWIAWKPWSILGAGAAFGAVGGVLMAIARTNAAETTRTFNAQCAGSCSPNTTGPYEGAQVQNGLGIAALAVGGVGMLGGAGMVLLNLPQSYRTQDESDVKVEVAPMVSASIVGLSTRVVF